MKLKLPIRDLHRSERELAHQLNVIAARHHSNRDIHHLAHDLAGWSQRHLSALAEHGRDHGLRLSAESGTGALTGFVKLRIGGKLLHRHRPSLLLVADLRRTHLLAAGTLLDWELLAQGAKVARDEKLVALASRCHPETLIQMRWANAMLKELSLQILAS